VLRSPALTPLRANASSPMSTCLTPPFALPREAAAPGVPGTPRWGPAMPAVPRRPPARTHRYSRENLVSSRLLCSHLNSRGQLPSAMHVRTRRFPSRWTWLLTGSVLKYGETSSAESGGKGAETRLAPQPARPHNLPSPTACPPHGSGTASSPARP